MKALYDTSDHLGYSPIDYKKFMKYANRMLFGFAFLYLFFYNARQNFGLAMPLMMEELGLTKTQLGLAKSTLFWTYGFGHLVSGRLSEVFGRKKFICIGMICSIIINVIVSFQSKLTPIIILWGLNGIFQSMVWSPGIGMSAQWWPKSRRGYATGIMCGFAGLSQILVMLCVSAAYLITPSWGWRAAFRLPLILLFIFWVIFIFIVKDKPSDVGLKDFRQDPEEEALSKAYKHLIETKGKLYPYIQLLREPKFIIFLVIILISGYARYALLGWLPTYFVETMGVDITEGIMNSILMPIGAAASCFLLPVLSDKVFKGKREPLLVFCAGLSIISLFIFPFTKSVLLASILLFILGFCTDISGVLWAFCGDIGSKEFTATATGIMDWASYMGSTLEGIAIGVMLDSFNSWPMVFISIGVMFIIMLALAFISTKIKVRGYATMEAAEQ